MTNKKPETIADLDINYIFTDYRKHLHEDIIEKRKKFVKDNKSLVKLQIKPATYQFLVNNHNFLADVFIYKDIADFIEYLNWKMYITDIIKLPQKLIKFELISENTFRIHLED